jgi:hypothetical protein
MGERRRARRRCGEQGRHNPGMCAGNVESSHGLWYQIVMNCDARKGIARIRGWFIEV